MPTYIWCVFLGKKIVYHNIMEPTPNILQQYQHHINDLYAITPEMLETISKMEPHEIIIILSCYDRVLQSLLRVMV